MKLSKRSLESLFWADQLGLSPKHFRSDDLFVSELGEVVVLMDAIPDSMVWVPRLTTMERLLRKKLGIYLKCKAQGTIVFISAEVEGRLIEGAGRSVEESLLSFIERLYDAYQQGLFVRNRSGDKEHPG